MLKKCANATSAFSNPTVAKTIISAMLRDKDVPTVIDVPKTTLLEQLRKKLVEPYPTKTSEGAELLKDLIVQHKNEFPFTFRMKLDFTLEEDHSCGVEFLDVLYNRALFSFLCCGWVIKLDTEEQVELLIRIFPSVLTEALQEGDRCIYQIHQLFSSSESVAFVPMALRVGKDLGISEEDMGIDRQYWPLHLLMNRQNYRVDSGVEFEENSPEFVNECLSISEFDQECLLALDHMLEIGLVTNDEICDMIPSLLSSCHEMDCSWIEKRVRFLVSWYPRILLDSQSDNCWDRSVDGCYLDKIYPITLLYEFTFWTEDAIDKTLIFRIFETILELGMQYFPTNLGFLFHGQTFQIACEWFGAEKIVDLVNNHIFNKLMRNSNKNKTLTRWIVEAASHDIVSLDCLYTLVRWDPLRCIKLLSTPNRKRRNSSRFPSKGKKRKFVQQSIAVWLNRVETLST